MWCLHLWPEQIIIFFLPSLLRLHLWRRKGWTQGGIGEIHGLNVMDLMSKLNLTEEEGIVVDFSDDEDDADLANVE